MLLNSQCLHMDTQKNFLRHLLKKGCTILTKTHAVSAAKVNNRRKLISHFLTRANFHLEYHYFHFEFFYFFSNHNTSGQFQHTLYRKQ